MGGGREWWVHQNDCRVDVNVEMVVDVRRIAGIIGQLPVPGALGVGASERRFHGCTQSMGTKRATLAKRLRQNGRNLKKGRGTIGLGMIGEKREGRCSLCSGGSEELHG